MEQSWDFEFLSRIADSCMAFLSEFVDDWLANDMRVSIFKILLVWLIFSLVAIHFAWKVYGTTVNDMYYRQGENEKPQICSCLMTLDGSDVCLLMHSGTGQNGGTPDAASHLAGWYVSETS